MSNLQYRHSKIKKKRQQASFRDFVMEICSRCPLVFYKNEGLVSTTPYTNRVGGIEDFAVFSERRDSFLGANDIQSTCSFMSQLQQLFSSIKLPNLIKYMENENADYCDMACGAKNAYLSSGVTFGSENVMYSFSVKQHNINVYNSVVVWNNCENIFSCCGVLESYSVFYSYFIKNSSDIWFSSNLTGCRECIMCDGLINQSYCINNEQLSPDLYYIKKQEILGQRDRYQSHYLHMQQGCNQGMIIGSDDIKDSSFVSDSIHIESGYFVHQIKDGKNLIMVGGKDPCEDMIDCFQCASKLENYNYAAIASGRGDYLACNYSVEGSYMYYNFLMEGCSFCLGCIGLKNKSYCILNRQYTKEERYQKVDEIFTQMEADGTLGDFFPASMNPFYFNDTAACLIDPSFTKEEVVAKGYLRRDEPIKVDIPANAEVVKVEELGKYEGSSVKMNGLGSSPRSEGQEVKGQQWYIDPSILKKIIQDPEGNIYRIVPMEYEFLMKHGLPLPRKHWLDRMKENFKIS